jgi:hypothetical protein
MNGMPGLAHRMSSQLAAVAVALALSGAPALLEPPSGGKGHRCQCPVKNGHHDCACPLCHAEAANLDASAADDPRLPACHRALAAKKRAEASRVDRSAKRRAATDHALTSSCGTSDPRFRAPPGSDRFMLPLAWQLPGRTATSEVAAVEALLLCALREPETPPPRAA